MSKYSKIVIFWGVCDIVSFLWYIGSCLYHGSIPFYTSLIQAVRTGASFGSYLPLSLTILSIFLYFTLLLSGSFLLKEKKIGAIISYIQTPFRFLTFIPPSLFFITWPLKHIFDNPNSTSASTTFIILVLLSEAVKIVSVILWHKNIKPITSA